MPEQPAQGGPEITELRRTSRDPEQVRRRLEDWLAGRLPAGSAPSVPAVHPTEATGVSTETLLFEARWTDGDWRVVAPAGGTWSGSYVPSPSGFTPFPRGQS